MNAKSPLGINPKFKRIGLSGRYAIGFQCPSCSLAMTATADEVEQNEICPECGILFVVPGAEILAERLNKKEKEQQTAQRRKGAESDHEQRKDHDDEVLLAEAFSPSNTTKESGGTSSHSKKISDETERKPCPFCKESIISSALKCRFCGEWLKTDAVKSERGVSETWNDLQFPSNLSFTDEPHSSEVRGKFDLNNLSVIDAAAIVAVIGGAVFLFGSTVGLTLLRLIAIVSVLLITAGLYGIWNQD